MGCEGAAEFQAHRGVVFAAGAVWPVAVAVFDGSAVPADPGQPALGVGRSGPQAGDAIDPLDAGFLGLTLPEVSLEAQELASARKLRAPGVGGADPNGAPFAAAVALIIPPRPTDGVCRVAPAGPSAGRENAATGESVGRTDSRRAAGPPGAAGP